MTAQLQQRLPVQPQRQHNLVMENDLVGRTALAVLWQCRGQLTIYLVTKDPADRNVVALCTALSTLRNSPAVEVITPAGAAELVVSSERLICALAHDRIDEHTHTALKQRAHANTFVPYAEPFAALSDQYPDQTVPSHELILRDIVSERAGFLNFFGDRFNPRDLYERSKYPNWFTPPPEFSAAIPPLNYSTIAPDGTVLDTEKFSGALQLATPSRYTWTTTT